MIIEELRDRHMGEIAWIVGKGPSLLNIVADMVGDGPIITINQAVRKIATLNLPNVVYSMQKDGAYKYLHDRGTCPKSCDDILDDQCPLGQTKLTHGEILLVHRYNSFCCWTDYEPRYVFNTDAWGLRNDTPSVVIALKVARLFGCKSVVMVAFDGITYDDTRLVEDGLSVIGISDKCYGRGQIKLVAPFLNEFENVSWLSPIIKLEFEE